MKILMVNKFYYIKGGSETYYFALKRMLESKGHTVIDFSMQDEKNFESEYSSSFVSHVDYGSGSGVGAKLKMTKNIIYSSEAKKKFEALVKETKPDIVHLHIFQHQISPSILDVIKKYDIPTVYTAHDLKMICLNYKMMHHGRICEDCRDGRLRHCVKNRCVKESAAKSMINLLEGTLHRIRKSYDAIDKIITPSDFYRKKFIEFGVSPDRLAHIPNFLDREAPSFSEREDKGYFLYFGRLSEEKGVLTLINAVENLPVRLYVIGTGPLKDELEGYIKERNITNVSLLGFKSGEELTELVGNSRAVVLPSEWYENGPYSAIESLQLKRPIIGADIGGIPELIDGNGLLFESGNTEQLRNAVVELDNMDEKTYSDLENASYELYKREYTPEAHFKRLAEVYGELGVKL